jgi:hypothetical protein
VVLALPASSPLDGGGQKQQLRRSNRHHPMTTSHWLFVLLVLGAVASVPDAVGFGRAGGGLSSVDTRGDHRGIRSSGSEELISTSAEGRRQLGERASPDRAGSDGRGMPLRALHAGSATGGIDLLTSASERVTTARFLSYSPYLPTGPPASPRPVV